MAGRLSVAQKLDMALSDFAASRDDEDRGPRDYGNRRRGLGFRGRDRSRDRGEPYDRRDRRDDRGKGGYGKGARRMPPEEKALLNTRCFFNEDGDLVVRLHDTEVFVLKKGPGQAEPVKSEDPGDLATPSKEAAEEATAKQSEAATKDGPAEEAGDRPKEAEDSPDAKEGKEEASKEGSEEGKAAGDSEAAEKPAQPAKDSAEAEKPTEDGAAEEPPAKVARTDAGGDGAEGTAPPAEPKAGETAPADGAAVPANEAKSEVKAEPSEAKAEPSDCKAVLVLTSGRFRTAETKYILNEVLEPLSLKVEEDDGVSDWRLTGDAVDDQPFADGMKVSLKSEVQPSEVKEHIEEKIRRVQESRNRPRDERRCDRRDDGRPPPPPPGWGHPPPGWPGYPGGYPPPHWGPPPPGWRPHGPPPYGGGPAWGPPPSRGGRGDAGHRPAEPLPDDMFQ